DLRKVESAPDGAARVRLLLKRRDLLSPDRVALVGARGCNWPGLQQPRTAIGPRPFHVAGTAVICFDLSPQLRERSQLRVAEAELLLSLLGDRGLSVRQSLDRLVAEVLFDHAAVGPVEGEAIRRHTAGDNALAQAPRRFNHHSVRIGGERIAG